MATIQPLQVPEYNPAAPSAFDFAPLAKLGEALQQKRLQDQQQSLAALAPAASAAGAASPYPSGGTAAVPYSSSGGAGGDNVKSWYDFARRPLEQGGLGLTHEQAAGKIANLQAESGQGIKPWGVTGDNGTAFGAAQWRGDRFTNLQKFAADRGLDYRSTAAQQAFMRHEYLGSENRAYTALTSARTPQEAATAINRYYERSADTTGGREANAARIARLFGGQ